jgi:hypothetical protein
MKSLIYVAVIAGAVWVALNSQMSSLFVGHKGNSRRPQTLPELFHAIGVENERREELNARSIGISRCLAEKDRIAQEVLAGRLELLEAAAMFRDVQNAVSGYDWKLFRAVTPGATDEEKLCRAAIGYVSLFAEESSAGGRAVLDRLETELNLHLESGTLRLRSKRASDPCPRQLN